MIVNIEKACEILRNDGVVAFPTETVYGLGADSASAIGCQKIYDLKSRPANNPLILHVCDIDMVFQVGKMHDLAYRLMEAFWPGPLTLVLSGANAKFAPSCAGLSTVAVRMPSHVAALDLIKAYGSPISAPSANKSGFVSSTSDYRVYEYFGENVPILHSDSAETKYGIESTIVNVSNEQDVYILRHGCITSEDLKSALHEQHKVIESSNHNQIIAPGMMHKHYSTHSPLNINATKDFVQSSDNCVVINFGDSGLVGAYSFNLSKKGDLLEASRMVYAMLQEADDLVRQHNLGGIHVAPIPYYGIGVAINDRLTRAAAE